MVNDYSEVLCDKLYDYCESVGHDFEAILPATVAAGFYETVYNFMSYMICWHTEEPQVEEVGDDWYLVKTGGMSWGDSPTDIFDVIVGTGFNFLTLLPGLVGRIHGTPPRRCSVLSPALMRLPARL